MPGGLNSGCVDARRRRTRTARPARRRVPSLSTAPLAKSPMPERQRDGRRRAAPRWSSRPRRAGGAVGRGRGDLAGRAAAGTPGLPSPAGSVTVDAVRGEVGHDGSPGSAGVDARAACRGWVAGADARGEQVAVGARFAQRRRRCGLPRRAALEVGPCGRACRRRRARCAAATAPGPTRWPRPHRSPRPTSPSTSTKNGATGTS